MTCISCPCFACRLYKSSRSISASQTPSTDVPGVAFAVTAGLSSNADGSAAYGVPASVKLIPSGDGTALCNTTQSCSVLSGAFNLSACQMELPCIGTFNLTVCTEDSTDQACNTVRRLNIAAFASYMIYPYLW